MQVLPGGLWPVMITPFDAQNRIDIAGLENLTEFYLSAGANGLFANCLSSEMFQLTEEERITITKKVVEVVKGRCSVVATGTFCKEVGPNSEFIKKIFDTGIEAVVINSNQLTDPGEGENIFKRKLEELLSLTGTIPLGVYECPVPYKRLLSPALMKWMGETGRFLYHKDTSCNLDDIKAKLEVIRGTPLGLYNANTPTALSSVKAGARGISPIAANFYPELFAYQWKYQDSEEHTEIVSRLDALLTVMDILIHQYYPLSAKLFLKKRGLVISENTRIPVSSLAQQDYIKLDAIIKVLNDLGHELGISLVKFAR